MKPLITRAGSLGFCVVFATLVSREPSFSATCAPPPPAMSAWWPGDLSAVDILGTNQGILFGSVPFVSGKVGQAFSLGQSSSHVRVPASPDLDIGVATGMTIEAWINPSELAMNRPIVEWAATGSSSLGAHFWVAPGTIVANLVDTAGAWHVIQAPDFTLVTSQFQHVAVTYNRESGVAQLYLNGSLVKESNLGIFTPKTTGDLYIGYRVPANGETVFKGLIDELAIYRRALSAPEIQAIFASGANGKCRQLGIAIHPQSQIGYWGKSVTLQVVAFGDPPLAYQWLKNDEPLSGSTNASLLLPNLEMTHAGSYRVVVTNLSGSITSNPAILTMNPAGVSVALYAGVTIEGVVGLTYGIQKTTELSDTNSWTGAANVTLGAPSQLWIDLDPAGSQPSCYFRVVPGPIPIPERASPQRGH